MQATELPRLLWYTVFEPLTSELVDNRGSHCATAVPIIHGNWTLDHWIGGRSCQQLRYHGSCHIGELSLDGWCDQYHATTFTSEESISFPLGRVDQWAQVPGGKIPPRSGFDYMTGRPASYCVVTLPKLREALNLKQLQYFLFHKWLTCLNQISVKIWVSKLFLMSPLDSCLWTYFNLLYFALA